MGACGLKTSLKFITKTKKINKDSLLLFSSSKCGTIARLAVQCNPFSMLFLYDTLLQQCLGIKAKSLYDQIGSKLIGSNIYLLKKKHGRQ